MPLESLSRFTALDGEVLFHDDDSVAGESAVEQTVFDKEVWVDMKAGKLFSFHIDRGLYDTQDVSEEFTMEKYIMAQPVGMSLRQIIGEGVALVTQRSVIFYALQKQMGLLFNEPVEISCERFNGVTFVKRKSKVALLDPTGDYRSVRAKRFNGPDLPGCVGKVPVRNFAFPDIGNMYSVIKMTGTTGRRVLYNSKFSRYSPEGETVELRAIDDEGWPSRSPKAQDRVFKKSALQTKLGCLDRFVFMHFNNAKGNVKAVVYPSANLNAWLDSELKRSGLDFEQMLKAFADVLFVQVDEFLVKHGRCHALLTQYSNGWQYVPSPVEKDYKPFLSQQFRDRFAPKKPTIPVDKNVEQQH